MPHGALGDGRLYMILSSALLKSKPRHLAALKPPGSVTVSDMSNDTTAERANTKALPRQKAVNSQNVMTVSLDSAGRGTSYRHVPVAVQLCPHSKKLEPQSHRQLHVNAPSSL